MVRHVGWQKQMSCIGRAGEGAVDESRVVRLSGKKKAWIHECRMDGYQHKNVDYLPRVAGLFLMGSRSGGLGHWGVGDAAVPQLASHC